MKRFYTDVTVLPEASGVGIALDGRPVRTPARAPLLLPTPALAEAVAAEWRAQGDMIDPAAMPFTGLANAAIDHVAPDPSAFADGIARYAQSDLLCYRADAPETLALRQAAAWDPLLDWARQRYDVTFTLTRGIIPVDQPADSIARLSAAVLALDPFALTGCGGGVAGGGHRRSLAKRTMGRRCGGGGPQRAAPARIFHGRSLLRDESNLKESEPGYCFVH